MTQDKESIARSAASQWCYCHKCDGVVNETGMRCDKERMHTCRKWYDGYRTALIALGEAKNDELTEFEEALADIVGYAISAAQVEPDKPTVAKGFADTFLSIARKQIEAERVPKTEETGTRLTVQGPGIYKICHRCGERMERDDSKVYTSDPPQYGYTCPKCGEVEFDTIRYDSPAKVEASPNFDPTLKAAEDVVDDSKTIGKEMVAYNCGKREILKDLPKWRKNDSYPQNFTGVIITGGDTTTLPVLVNEGYEISIKELFEKLPKE